MSFGGKSLPGNKLGRSSVRVSLLKNAKNTVVKFVVGLLTPDDRDSLNCMLKSVTLAVSVQRMFSAEGILSNYDAVLSFILKAVFGWEKRFITRNKVRHTPALLISDGRVAMEQKIDNYLAADQGFLTADERFEVEKMKDLVRYLKYSGMTICYVGNIRIFEEGKNEEVAELDGILICPTMSAKKTFGYILEAKNYNNGSTDAIKQLEQKVRPTVQPFLKIQIQALNNRTAYVE